MRRNGDAAGYSRLLMAKYGQSWSILIRLILRCTRETQVLLRSTSYPLALALAPLGNSQEEVTSEVSLWEAVPVGPRPCLRTVDELRVCSGMF